MLTISEDRNARIDFNGNRGQANGTETTYDQNLESPRLAKRSSMNNEEELLGLKLYYEALRKGKYPQSSVSRFNVGKAGYRCLFARKGENEGKVGKLLELSSEDELAEPETGGYVNRLELGFTSKQIKRHSNLLNADRMPVMSFQFYDIDYNKALKDNERQLRNQKAHVRKAADNVSLDVRVTKPKKGEISLVITPRMNEFDSLNRTASKDNAFICLSDVSVSTVQDQSYTYESSWKSMGDMLLLVRKYFSRGDTEANAKKIALLCSKERKKTLVKYKKLSVDYVLRAKKYIKDVQAFFKKKFKEVQDLRKKKDKFEVEVKKKEEEQREQEKQKRKIEFLIKQSSIYAEIMANKLGITAPNVQSQSLIELNKEDEKQAEMNVNRMMENVKAKRDEYDHLKDSQSRKNSAQNYDFSQVEIDKTSSLIDVPKSFHGTLKSYQLKGLRWLDSLYLQGINGILADEMGLGKTIQALALLAHLSSNNNNWGPYLVIAPAITLFNWHSEIQRFCPELKVLPYWGSLKERKVLRRYFQQKSLGKKESTFHVFITSYQIGVSDEKILHRLRWQYVILDEAQAIKNMNSIRWNTLLGLKSRNKLLLTGTPIQNTMAELWALLHFIMPQLFDSHEQFQEWFSKNIEVESKQKLNQIQLNRLHAILKPFMLRRVKKDVETEIGKKFEHEVFCELSRRQKELYKKLKSRISLESLFQIRENKEKVKNLMNLVMQFRKVCNHPELFERQIVKSPVLFSEETFAPSALAFSSFYKMNAVYFNNCNNPLNFIVPKTLAGFCRDSRVPVSKTLQLDVLHDYKALLWLSDIEFSMAINPTEQNLLALIAAQHYLHKRNRAVCSLQLEAPPVPTIPHLYHDPAFRLFSSLYMDKMVAQPINMISHIRTDNTSVDLWRASPCKLYESTFPSFQSLINDSTKLKYLDKLLKDIKAKGLRGLIFCQMTKMLDILEDFLQYKRYKYFRLDGSSDIGVRKDMVNEFQKNEEIFVFLLSTRAGGLGVTLTAADVVIFYDNDWNPTMDAQAADRAHRIGRTEDVHVYNLITKDTIEERIVKRAKQKKDVQQTLYSGDAFKANIFKPQEVFTLLFDEADIKQKKDVILKQPPKNAEEGKKKAKEQTKKLTAEEELQNVLNEIEMNGGIDMSKF